MLKFLHKIEYLFTVISLFLYTSGPIYFILPTFNLSFLAEPVMLTVYFITLTLMLQRWKLSFWVLRKEFLLIFLMLFCASSVLWSSSPEITLVRYIALLGTTLFGVYLSVRYTLESQLKILWLTLSIASLASILVVITLPGLGISGAEVDYGWRGIYNQKNEFGALMAFYGIVSLLNYKGKNRYKFFFLATTALAFFLVMMSRSTTALLVLTIGIVVVFVTRLLRVPPKTFAFSVLLFLLISFILLVIVFVSQDQILTMLGKDPTLTGRTILWDWVIQYITKKIWLGYGFSAFWGVESSLIWHQMDYEAPHAHNGLLDLWLQLGFWGFIIYLLIVVKYFLGAIKLVRKSRLFYTLFPLIFLLFSAFINYSESFILRQNSLYWVLFVSCILSITLYRRHESIV
jgi:exopolysaccharide production protein ExoQ